VQYATVLFRADGPSAPDRARRLSASEPFYGVYEPGTRTIYANGVPTSTAGVGALLDAVLQMDRRLKEAPPPLKSIPRKTKPSLALVKNSGQSKP
jgi:hypothetical protein